MPSSNLLEHDRQISNLAEEYLRRGYEVSIEPPSNLLPDFLQDFRPDMLASGPDGNVVVEVKTRRNGGSSRNYDELKQRIEAHPGWRFELILMPPSEEETAPSLSLEEIKLRVEQANQLTGEDVRPAALLMGWSALEGAMRAVCREFDIRLRASGPAALVSTLYSEGFLDREDYDALMHCLNLRNRVAHGYSSPVEAECVQRIQNVTGQLLSEIAEKTAA